MKSKPEKSQKHPGSRSEEWGIQGEKLPKKDQQYDWRLAASHKEWKPKTVKEKVQSKIIYPAKKYIFMHQKCGRSLKKCSLQGMVIKKQYGRPLCATWSDIYFHLLSILV